MPLGVAPVNATTAGAAGPSLSVGIDLVRMLTASAIDASPGQRRAGDVQLRVAGGAYVMSGSVSAGGSLTGVIVIVKVSAPTC